MDNKAKNILQSLKLTAINKKRVCMYSGCCAPAIKSHVLQKNGILKQISQNNHLIQLSSTSINEIEEKGLFHFKSIGINDAYTFNGFCAKHDDALFKPIESEHLLDFYNPLHQCLFSYRGLCQEIRRKEILIEWMGDTRIFKIDPFLFNNLSSLNDGFKQGLKNLTFFKQEMEKSIKTNNFIDFKFSTVKIPKIELCISVPLNIDEVDNINPLNIEYEEWKDSLSIPFNNSFINVFPYKGDSYFISGYHKAYPCKWTENKSVKLAYLKNNKLRKELSDLVVLRLEFWVMSPRLFEKIPIQLIEKYKRIFSKNVMSHSAKLKTDINLFEKI